MIQLIPNKALNITTNNCIIHNNDKECYIENNTAEFSWVLFPLNSCWSRETISNNYQLTIRGDFSDVVDISLVYDNEKCIINSEIISLKSGINEFNIPMKILNKESKTWNHLKIVLNSQVQARIKEIKICPKNFKAADKLIYHFTGVGEAPTKWRRGELGHFSNITRDEIRDNCIVYCRPVSESLKYSEYKKMLKMLDKLDERYNIKIINHLKYFYNSSLKNKTFDIWDSHNIPHPKYEIYSDEACKQWQESKGKFIIRLNNNENGNHSFVYIPEQEIRNNNRIKKYKNYKIKFIDNGFNFTDIMMIERIPPTKINDTFVNLGGKAYIVNNKIICCVPDIYRYRENILRGWFNTDFDIFVKSCEIFYNTIGDYKKIMIEAVSCLGLNAASLDFLINSNGDIIFLEANSSWGLSSVGTDFPFDEKLLEQIIKEKKILKKQFPEIYNRMDLQKFWSKFYKEI